MCVCLCERERDGVVGVLQKSELSRQEGSVIWGKCEREAVCARERRSDPRGAVDVKREESGGSQGALEKGLALTHASTNTRQEGQGRSLAQPENYKQN